MIAVIADDFTGAAEIGGIGLRHGLNVIIETEPIRNRLADLIIIATNTRSLRADEASRQIIQITEHLLQFNPKFIFKKIDSVLRGNIKEELLAQMKVSGKTRALVIAANPVFKRIIRDGVYYIDDIPLNETRFSSDPQYPTKSSAVKEILGANERSVLYNLKKKSRWNHQLRREITCLGARIRRTLFLTDIYALIPLGQKPRTWSRSAYP